MVDMKDKAWCKFVLLLTLFLAAAGEVEAQQPLLSPRDSTEIVIAGKKVSVNYGRPSMRKRKIMGELVPFNVVWRTGANEATAFVTEADLQIGGVKLPAGSYTLYTLPSQKQWKLIINKQTGQWGTVYDAHLDFARVNLKKKTLKNPVEKFLISFKRNGSAGGIMVLEWENTSLSISFKVLSTRKSSSSKSIM
ncbi:MAG TPA: DUF2911 domain-containing protein [Bacteroidota bacterium]|nr:DUF2911 domain-containing protein [Bacteroidota bacterium]